MELINKLPSTAELAFGLMISIVRNIPSGLDDVKNNGWDYDKFIGHQLKGKTIGIIGYGRLGRMLEEMCKNIFKEIIVVDRSTEYYDELFEKCDVLSLHVDLNPTSYQMINEEFLNKFKKSIYIVNTSRGEIVNEYDINEQNKNERKINNDK